MSNFHFKSLYMYTYVLLLVLICSLFLKIGISKDISHAKGTNTYLQSTLEVTADDSMLIHSDKIVFPQNVQLLCQGECLLDIECLLESYPGIITGIMADEQNRIWLVINGDKQVLYDDGKKRTYNEALLEGTVKDSMVQVYPLEPTRPIPGVDVAPGRIRSTDFLQAVYGNSKEMVSKNLVTVKVQEKQLLFTKIADAAQSLQNVSIGLDMLLQKEPEVIKYIMPLLGSFNWRLIIGEKVLSPHSYGIAIDLNRSKGRYWQWTKNRKLYLETQKTYPSELVRIFEENGFIWGGKWYEFDFMHFEYRPELICKAKRCVQ